MLLNSICGSGNGASVSPARSQLAAQQFSFVGTASSEEATAAASPRNKDSIYFEMQLLTFSIYHRQV